jgi:3-oxoacyl-[acyl-carrier-protein] synthase-1
VKKSIILKNAAVITALGPLNATVESLFAGVSGLKTGHSFGIPVPVAPFHDIIYRSIGNTASTFVPVLQGCTIDFSRTVFIYCSAKGDLSAFSSEEKRGISPLLDNQAKLSAQILGLSDCHIMVVSSACASGSVAIETAKNLLERGLFTHAVIFGFDALSQFVISGFNSLSALSPDAARPFDKKRNGLMLGEGAAIAVLSVEIPEKGEIVISGAANTNDANHRTGPSRTGEGLYRAAKSALDDANVKPQEIGAVKCHGTATNYNDAMEAKAMFSLFGLSIPPSFSLKGALGHTSGASSLVETILAAQFLKRKQIPPTIGFEESGVDEPMPIKSDCQPISTNKILCLSAGFGGLNAAIVLEEIAHE